MYVVDLGKVIPSTAITTVPTSPAVNVASAPIILRPKMIVASNTVAFPSPGSGVHMDAYGCEFTAKYTAQSGTSPTAQLKVQGANNLNEIQTTLTGSMTAATTSAALTSVTGIAANTYILVYRADGSGYEWMLNTSAAATGAGTLTVTRAQFGTTAITFSASDYVFYVQSWVDIPSANSTTTTLISGALASISAAAASTPVIQTVSSHALGLSSIEYPIIRAVVLMGGTTPTSTVEVTGSLKMRAKTVN